MTRMDALRLTGIAALLAASTPLVAAAPTDDRAATLRLLQQQDARVALVAYRLATANVRLCRRTKPQTGLVLYAADQFGPDYRDAARRLFGVDEGVAVGVVVPGSAADRAGIKPRDVILAVDGTPLASAGAAPGTAGASFQSVQNALDRIDLGLSDGMAELRVLRGGTVVDFQVQGESGCASMVQLVPSEDRNASADGQIVTITSEVAALARDDDELAALVAHELAHNILDHRARLAKAGVSNGLFGALGKRGRLIRASEDEADRLSIHLMAGAGFRVDMAAAFWKRLIRIAQPAFHDGTHRGANARAALIEAEVAVVRTGVATDLAQFTRESQLPGAPE